MAIADLNTKSCEELQAALNAARAMLEPPALDPITGLGATRGPREAPYAPEAPAGVMDEIRAIENAMREQGCTIS